MSRKKAPKTDMKYSTGAVTRIWASNFLVFTEFEMRPEPNLNLIIGPNGTGKSSLVNAIILGLAGKPAVLGRAKNITDYIQYGKDKAVLQIELHNEDGPNWKIQRDIKSNGSSIWYINGQATTLKNVEELMTQLKIQVGNLCQFLPQDRVADFAKMSAVELLQNTQKATGGIVMYQQHQDLIRLRADCQKLEKHIGSGQENLDQEQTQHNRMKDLIKTNDERKQHLATVEMLKKKKAWVEYTNARESHNQKKKELEDKEKELKEMETRFAPQEKQVGTLKGKVENCRLKYLKLQHPKNVDQLTRGLNARLDEVSDKIADAKNSLLCKEEEHHNRQTRIKNLTQQITALESEYAGIQDTTENTEDSVHQFKLEIQELTKEISEVQNRQLQLKHRKDTHEQELRGIRQELTRLKDVTRLREDMLRSMNSNTYDALKWMRENKEKFRNAVYEPIMLHINLTDNKFAKFIENHIAMRDMFAFAFEDKEDRELFMREVSDKRGLRVNAVDVPREPLSRFVPAHDIAAYKKWGFGGYLRDYIQAPDGVMRYLCKQFNIHDVPIGNKLTENNLDAVQEVVPFRRYYTDSIKVVTLISRYSRNKSTSTSDLRPARLLASSTDQSRIDELEAKVGSLTTLINEVNAQMESIASEEKELLMRREDRKQALRKLNDSMNYVRQLKVKIQRSKQNREELMKVTFDLQEERRISKTAVKVLVMQKAALLKSHAQELKSLFTSSHKRVLASAELAVAHNSLKLAEQKLEEDKRSLKEHRENVVKLKKEVLEYKETAKGLLSAAKKMTGLRDNEQLPQRIKQIFEEYPNDLEGIQIKIYDEETRANLLVPVDQNVIREYQQRAATISRLEEDISQRSAQLEKLQSDMQEIKEDWLPALEDLIQRINGNFSDFFSRLKCVGEIVLDKSNNSEDYHKWGINIRVKFRDSEPLKELTAMHHSGGEQSVSTALYMLALQELTKVPFRCVDEINQGMDPRNERKVFDLMTETACQRNNAQYFLLTPKLLPDLTYSKNMKVFIINNGPYYECAKNWSIPQFIEKQLQL